MTEVQRYTAHRSFNSNEPVTVLGVPGTLKERSVYPKTKIGCWHYQIWVSEQRTGEDDYGRPVKLRVQLAYDDDCRNGHNSMSVLGERRYPEDRATDVGFCADHELIPKLFPELAHLVKWHTVNADGPWGYIGNTTYLAGDLDCRGKRKGEPWAWDAAIRFGDFPITKKLDHRFAKWLEAALEHQATTLKTNPNRREFEIVEVPYSGNDTYKFQPKYSFDDFCSKWHECPFDTRQQAEEFKAALALGVEFIKITTLFSEGKERELDRARNAAVWPEATDEQLMLPKEELTKLLEARLPALMAQFRADIEAAGLFWSPEDYQE